MRIINSFFKARYLNLYNHILVIYCGPEALLTDHISIELRLFIDLLAFEILRFC